MPLRLSQKPATSKLIQQIDDVYALSNPSKELQIPTHYERLHRGDGAKIKYLSFSL